MIKTNNAELDDVISVVQSQSNEAQDAIALLVAKLKAQEALTVDLKKQLEEALKEGDK